MRTVVRVGTGSQFVKKLKRTEENRLVTVFLGFDKPFLQRLYGCHFCRLYILDFDAVCEK